MKSALLSTASQLPNCSGNDFLTGTSLSKTKGSSTRTGTLPELLLLLLLRSVVKAHYYSSPAGKMMMMEGPLVLHVPVHAIAPGILI